MTSIYNPQTLPDSEHADQAVERAKELLRLRALETARKSSLFIGVFGFIGKLFYRLAGYFPRLSWLRTNISDSPTVLPAETSAHLNLAEALATRFNLTFSFSDLEEAMIHFRSTLDMLPADLSQRLRCSRNLADMLHNQFLLRGSKSDLDEAISLYREALRLLPHDDPERCVYSTDLAFALLSQFASQGEPPALTEANTLSQDAMESLRPDDLARSRTLTARAACLVYQVQLLESSPDLQQALTHARTALELCPSGHQDRSLVMYTLATCLLVHHRLQGYRNLSDLEEGIQLARSSLDLRPVGHPRRAISLKDLGNGLLMRVQVRGRLSDLNEAIEMHRAALDLVPPTHLNRSIFLFSLSVSLSARYQLQGPIEDLDDAIKLSQECLSLRPPGHSERNVTLGNLANCLWIRYEQRGKPSDLDEAVSLHEAALDICPHGHPDRPSTLNNLSVCYWTRFQRRGSPSDLDRAIELHQEALALVNPMHSTRSVLLNNLANYFWARYEQRGLATDLDSAIEQHRAVLALRGAGHPDRSSTLTNLALVLSIRFHQTGVQSDLHEAIKFNEEALGLHPNSDPSRSVLLSNLAENLQTRYRRCGRMLADLERAIKLSNAALQDSDSGHPERPTTLSILADSLYTRFQESHSESDLNEAIEACYAALSQCDEGHQRFGAVVGQLAELLLQKADGSATEEGFLQYSKLSHLRTSGISRDALSAAQRWTENAEKFDHASVLEAYKTSLEMLDRLVAITTSISVRHEILKANISTLAADAFSCAVRRGKAQTAVEFLEQGRAILWTQLSRFRTPIQDLADSGDEGKSLAQQFTELSFQLRKATEDTASDGDTTNIQKVSTQWEETLERIRSVPGFSRFLLPPLFPDLRKAAKAGPVIIVNASRYSCDALIILHTSDPITISLGVAKEHVSQLSSRFRQITRATVTDDERREVLLSILTELWAFVVSPVVQILSGLNVRAKRLWWCPTGEFTALPLHAAGPYTAGMSNLSDIYLSSYTPTLKALIRARQGAKPADAVQQDFLAIGQPEPYEGTPLPSVAQEIEIVAERTKKPSVAFAALLGRAATVENVLKELPRHRWAHLACHGRPDAAHPFSSSFSMQDGPLSLSQVIQEELQEPEFAFLSACHTAAYNETTPDEAVHLAAAMQFSGFRSVVGTMWAVDDALVGRVVSDFYANVFDKAGRLDNKRTVLALNKAIAPLHKDPGVPLDQRIVFIHIGA